MAGGTWGVLYAPVAAPSRYRGQRPSGLCRSIPHPPPSPLVSAAWTPQG